MPMSVKLSNDLISKARQYGEVYNRSISEQIEHWATIGRIAEENPDLCFNFINDILLARQEAAEGQVTPFEFG